MPPKLPNIKLLPAFQKHWVEFPVEFLRHQMPEMCGAELKLFLYVYHQTYGIDAPEIVRTLREYATRTGLSTATVKKTLLQQAKYKQIILREVTSKSGKKLYGCSIPISLVKPEFDCWAEDEKWDIAERERWERSWQTLEDYQQQKLEKQ